MGSPKLRVNFCHINIYVLEECTLTSLDPQRGPNAKNLNIIVFIQVRVIEHLLKEEQTFFVHA